MLPLTVAWRHVRRLVSFTDWRSTELGCMWKPRNLTSSAPDFLRINFAGFSPNLNGDHIISWVTNGSTVGLVLAGDPVKRHVLPHYDVQELAGNLGSDNAPPSSTCIKYFNTSSENVKQQFSSASVKLRSMVIARASRTADFEALLTP